MLSEAEKERLLQTARAAEEEIRYMQPRPVTADENNLKNTLVDITTTATPEEKDKLLGTLKQELDLEAALERVRIIAMRMKTPDDLLNICEILYNELRHSGFAELRNTMINLHNDADRFFLNYDFAPHTGKTITKILYDSSPIVQSHVHQIKSTKDAFAEIVLTGQELADWRNFRKDNGEQDDPRLDEVAALHYYFYSVDTGDVGISTYEFISDEQLAVFKRFRNVFDLAYRRYMDIAFAEQQAREARIEAALEKVRSRSLAMHSSDEIRNVVAMVVEKMKELDIETQGGISLVTYLPNCKDLLHWYVNPDHVSGQYTLHLPYFDNLVFNDCLAARNKGQELLAKVYSFEEKNEYFSYAFEHSDFAMAPPEFKQWILAQPYFVFLFASQKNSGIFLNDYTGKIFSQEDNEILIRFSRVFEQAYVRFLDLQKAEAQARESQIEASLERVRSRTLAMQKSSELPAAAAVLFRQLINLGIEPHRLYITLIKDDGGDAEFWITDEDGSKVSAAYTSNLHVIAAFEKMYVGWKENRTSLVIDMRGAELQEYLEHMSSLQVSFKDGLVQTRRILHLAYFTRGFIGMASLDDQPTETIQLLERFAAVFNLTSTRFNDLKAAEKHAMQAGEDLVKLQVEKKRAEDALTELKSAQMQLIQAEKMASLGQLTAGIAHEIQNPLNFVNNFSEVTKELLQDMQMAYENSDADEARELAAEVIDNLAKINFHGRRAEAIVRGMLQHSRNDLGIKEPTDINMLCNELLRLSYHGVRGKEKNLRAEFATYFDESVGKINLVPQEISRVLLNLFNNAFYAVNERSKTAGEQYKPLVTVTTKPAINKGRSGVEVLVTDNGNGMPEHLTEKIFQPFFTTKPSGQGTGLGLSLSYDMINAHGGEIKVATQEGTGTTFSVFLPQV